MERFFPGVFKVHGRIATKNSVEGSRVYGEKLVRMRGGEYRIWDPFRSKLAAAILNGLKDFPLRDDSNVLYLGASSGTTASHISDLTHGMVYCVEFSKRMMRELMIVCQKRSNMVPVLGDVRSPREYYSKIGAADFVYQDVAQPNQAEILIKNVELFNPRAAMICIKARSIDAVGDPMKIFKAEVEKLKGRFDVLQVIDLRPYDKDHVLVSLRVK